MRLIEKIQESFALVDLQGNEKEKVLAEMVDKISESASLAKGLRNEILSNLLKRESLGSTGIGNGFSIPHSKIEGLEDFFLSIGRTPGIDFNAVDNAPVKIIFMLVSPKGQDTQHLEFLKRIATLGRNEDFVKFLGNAKDAKEVIELVDEMDT
jgi:mannitol/fructose-specific phosphotransferase system IIA component (Ntr-type)